VTNALEGTDVGLLVSTKDDVVSSGAPGLDSWTDGEALFFGDPNLAFEPTGTNGTFSSALDLNPFFDSGDVDVTALHYVTTDITVGSGVNTFDLKAGDVLFALDTDETIGGTTYFDNDVHVFRPDTPGDYSSGTISVLLDSLSTFDTRAITLVERDTLVGDVTLQAGTFLYSDNNFASEIRHFDATGVGKGTTTGTKQTFLNATGALNITQDFGGLELIEVETTIGGETLAAGTILATVAEPDSVGNNSLVVDDSDIFKLTVSQTIMGSATSDAIVDLFMDGSAVNLGAGSEDIVALSLTDAPVNNAPTTSGISNVVVNEDAVDSIIDLFAAFADIEDLDLALTYTVTGNTNAALFTSTAIDGVAGTLTLDYAPDQNGVSNITIRAIDTGGLFVETTFTVTVNAVNDVPVASANKVTTNEDTAYTFVVGDFTYADVETDAPVSVTITNLNLAGGTLEHSSGVTVTNGMTLTTVQIATLVYSPANNSTGAPLATCDFTVNDSGTGILDSKVQGGQRSAG
jgi:hypothetical protein